MNTVPNVRAYFDGVAESFADAAAAVGVARERTITVAGHGARLHFAGDGLVPCIMPALAHLEGSSVPASLNVSLFDSGTTGIPLRFPDAQGQGFSPQAEGWLYTDGGCYILWNPFFKTLTMLDRERGEGFFWTEDAKGFSYHESSFPMRNIWQWWLKGDGFQLAHAGAVANERGAAVIAGAGGAGKSTVALACLASRLCYLGDDFVLTRAEPGPRVFSLYSSAKLHPDHWRRFSHLQDTVSNADRLDEEKALLFVSEHFGDKMCLEAPARALLLPRVVGRGKTCAREIPAVRALRELAASTLFLLHGSGKAEFEALARFARRLPCYELELGSDLSEIPEVVQEVLAW